jgi:hypothetical protein
MPMEGLVWPEGCSLATSATKGRAPRYLPRIPTSLKVMEETMPFKMGLTPAGDVVYTCKSCQPQTKRLGKHYKHVSRTHSSTGKRAS